MSKVDCYKTRAMNRFNLIRQNIIEEGDVDKGGKKMLRAGDMDEEGVNTDSLCWRMQRAAPHHQSRNKESGGIAMPLC